MSSNAPFDESLATGSVGLDEVLVEIRRRYRSEPVPPVGVALSAFVKVSPANGTGDLPVTAAGNAHGPALQATGLPNRRLAPARRRQRIGYAITTFAGTLIGKIVLGATLAAAAVGGAQAAGVIDIPGLPDRSDRPTLVEDHTGPSDPATGDTIDDDPSADHHDHDSTRPGETDTSSTRGGDDGDPSETDTSSTGDGDDGDPSDVDGAGPREASSAEPSDETSRPSTGDDSSNGLDDIDGAPTGP